MELSLYQVDAFASKVFEGNPAAVCPLDEWVPDDIMQSIAAENNLSETAFFVPTDTGFHIRWFTPAAEVELCGHATLAAAHVLFHSLGFDKDKIAFQSQSGILTVARAKNGLVMDFPLQPPMPCDTPDEIIAAFGRRLLECLKAEDYMVVLPTEEDVRSANPDLTPLLDLDLRGVIITAPSIKYDFVSRFFAPKYGIPEDPVTGSAHTQLVPYWESKLNITRFHAKQVSPRGGKLFCERLGNRVLIHGEAVMYLKGTISI